MVNLKENGKDIKKHGGNYRLRDVSYYFRPGVTWGRIGSSRMSARFSPSGCVFGDAGTTAYAPTSDDLLFGLAVLLSCTTKHFLEAISPTLNFQVYHVSAVPLADPDSFSIEQANTLRNNAHRAVEIAEQDWNCLETSWQFKQNPLIRRSRRSIEIHGERTLVVDFGNWKTECDRRRRAIRGIEEENNRLFIEAYGLRDELSSEVRDDQITLYSPDREEDIKRLISYAIGCMMGRYSLDNAGLIYAHSENEGFDPKQYETFNADDDGIIPLLEIDWGIQEDAAERIVEFIGLAWPKENLEENLKFIADSLSPGKDERPRDTIRRYLGTGFYKHHLSMYKRRPVYWLFSSGKQRAFQCLVYLHRYNEGTLARMRTEYVIPLQGKLSSRIDQLAADIQKATATSYRKKLEKERDTLLRQQAELKVFDEKLRHYADIRIRLDLDDGVKVNYGKFGDLLAEVKAVIGGSDD